MEKYQAAIGNYVVPDGWRIGELLKADDGFKDAEFPGCAFRLPSTGGELAVNIKTTGKPRWYAGGWRSRIKIEFVGDGAPSSFNGGWIYHK